MRRNVIPNPGEPFMYLGEMCKHLLEDLIRMH
jgi:hypothetical protein